MLVARVFQDYGVQHADETGKFIMVKNSCNVAILICLFALASCQQSESGIAFCGFRDGASVEKSYFNFNDSGNFRLYGADTSYKLEILENDVAKGFVSPFPLALPIIHLKQLETPLTWRLGEFEFTVTTVSPTDPDWVLIHAQPAKDTLTKKPDHISTRQTSVLYSISDGVLAIRQRTTLEGLTIQGASYLCAPKSFHAADFDRGIATN